MDNGTLVGLGILYAVIAVVTFIANFEPIGASARLSAARAIFWPLFAIIQLGIGVVEAFKEGF